MAEDLRPRLLSRGVSFNEGAAIAAAGHDVTRRMSLLAEYNDSPKAVKLGTEGFTSKRSSSTGSTTVVSLDTATGHLMSLASENVVEVGSASESKGVSGNTRVECGMSHRRIELVAISL